MNVYSESQGLTPGAFDKLMANLTVPFPWALAVSGGSDSVALMVLAAAWAKANGHPLPIVLTVDHGLRPASAAEARQVAAWAKTYDLDSKVLTWKAAKPQKNIQSLAREARYRLLSEACLELGVKSLLTAHTQDDQAETFMLRLARGSGVDGLAAMRPVAELPLSDPRFKALVLVRPLLSVDRLSLQAALRSADQSWLTDPSNEDTRYARVRMRKALGLLANEGIDAARLAKTASLMNRARQALGDGAMTLCSQVARFDNAGFAFFGAAELLNAPQELGLRALSTILQSVGGAIYRPRMVRLERLYDMLKLDQDGNPQAMGRGATLGGCRIVRTKGIGRYLVVREMAGLRARLHRDERGARLGFGERQLWDNRFEIALTGPQDSNSFDWNGEIRPLGRAGLAQAGAFEECAGSMKELPALVRPTLPALWVGDRVVAAPHLGLLDQSQFPASMDATLAVTATFMGRPDQQKTGSEGDMKSHSGVGNSVSKR